MIITFEIKKMHQLMGKRLFEMHQEKNASGYPSPLQMEIIEFLLKNREDVFLKNIQEYLHISKAAVSDVIDKMEKKGFIRKEVCSTDARKTKLILLDEGKNVFQKLKENISRLNEEMIDGLTEEELKEYIRITQIIEMNLEKEGRI